MVKDLPFLGGSARPCRSRTHVKVHSRGLDSAFVENASSLSKKASREVQLVITRDNTLLRLVCLGDALPTGKRLNER